MALGDGPAGSLLRQRMKKERHATMYGCGPKTAYFGINNEKEQFMRFKNGDRVRLLREHHEANIGRDGTFECYGRINSAFVKFDGHYDVTEVLRPDKSLRKIEEEQTMKDTELIDTIRVIVENQAEQKTQGISDELNKLKNRMFSIEQEQKRQISHDNRKKSWHYDEIRGLQKNINLFITHLAEVHSCSQEEIRQIIIQEGMI